MGVNNKPRIEFQVWEVPSRRDDTPCHRADTYEECERWINDRPDDMMSDPEYEIRKVFTYRKKR